MKPIHDLWTDFDSSSYTWELYEALNKMSKLMTKYERIWNENKN